MESDGSRAAPPPVDPRPLTGEPVSLDLLNTVWIDGGGRHDLLADAAGLDVWLSAHGFDDQVPADPATRTATRTALTHAREAIRAHVAHPGTAETEALNAVLARGASSRRLTADGPVVAARVDDVVELPGWTAADDYLRLLERDASRIRRCAHGDCVLTFYDTSRRNDRRWCSMAGCGNRAKAARHYARTRHGPR